MCAGGGGDTSSDGTAAERAALRAQRFFESQAGPLSLPDTYYKAGGESSATRSVELQSLLSGAVEPDWSGARVWETDEIVGTEVPAVLTRPVRYVVRIEETGEIVSLTNQAPHVRIIFNEYKEMDETCYFLATLLPDEYYDGSLLNLASDPEGSDYYGVTIYSHPDGTPAWGWRYEDGEIVSTLLFDEAYADLADPDIRISMGIGSGTATRAQDQGPSYGGTIPDVVVDAINTKKIFDDLWEDMFRVEHIKWQIISDENTDGGSPGSSSGTPSTPSEEDNDDRGDKEPTDPCASMRNKMNDPEFNRLLNALLSLTSENWEAGYSYKYTSDGYTLFPCNGAPNTHEIIWHPSSSNKIDGFFHTHVGGGLPIFSPNDLLVPGEWNRIGGINDLGRFSLGVVTSSGTYFLQITNPTAYKAFYNQYSQDGWNQIFQGKYLAVINQQTSPSDAVKALLKFFNDFNMGLTLMKKSGDQFKRTSLDSGNNVKEISC